MMDLKIGLSFAVVIITMLAVMFILKPLDWDVYKAELTQEGCSWASGNRIKIYQKDDKRCTALLRMKHYMFKDDVAILADDDRIVTLSGRAITAVADTTEAASVKQTPGQAAVGSRAGWLIFWAAIAILLIWGLPPYPKSKHIYH